MPPTSSAQAASAAASAAAANPKRVAIKPQDWEAKINEVQVSRSDLNSLVMDYLVVEGYKEAAENFAREAGMASQADFESIHNRMTIRNAIHRGDIVEAIERVNDLDPEILDNNPALYFHLQQQRLIELIRQKKVDEALTFAQEELAPRGEEHPEFLSELEQTMTLLAYDVDLAAVDAALAKNAAAAAAAAAGSAGEGAGNDVASAAMDESNGGSGSDASGIPSFVTSLLHPAHRQSTAAQVNAAILTSQSLGPTPKLPNLLRLLAWGEQLLGERADFPALETRIKPVFPSSSSSMQPSQSQAHQTSDVAMH